MTITIRQSTALDAQEIGNLAVEFQSYLRSLGSDATFNWGAEQYLRDGFGQNPAFEGLVAEIKSQVVAYALFHFGYDTDRGQRIVYLIDLYVSQLHRGSGIGERLMHHLSILGQARGAELIAWSVLKQNASALKFYQKLGAQYADDLYTMWCPIPSVEVHADIAG